MLFHVAMAVRIPHGISLVELDRLKLAKKRRAQEPQTAGTWRHLWRVAGRYSNISFFDARDRRSGTRFCPDCGFSRSWRSR